MSAFVKSASLAKVVQDNCATGTVGHQQELQLFLEKEGQLTSDPEWVHLQPASGGMLDGLHRLPRQLLGVYSLLIGDMADVSKSTHAWCSQQVMIMLFNM